MKPEVEPREAEVAELDGNWAAIGRRGEIGSGKVVGGQNRK